MAIAIFGDGQSELALLLPAIKHVCDEVHFCDSLEGLSDLVIDHKISLLLFCFDDVRLAENMMSKIVDKELFTQTATPSMLLLCRGADAKKASELCKERLFTDFAIVKPLQDIHQFEWFIRRNLDNYQPDFDHEVDKLMKLLWQKLDKLRAALLEIEVVPQRVNDEATRIISELSRAFTQLRHSASERPKDVSDNAFLLSMKRLPSKLSSSLDDFQKTYVSRGLSQIESIQDDVRQTEQRLARLAKKRVLIVDDNHDFRVLIREVLEASGYEVISAADATTAITHLFHSQPDLVLIDYDMPQVNGLEMLSHLSGMKKSWQKLPPLIMMTGHSQLELVQKSAEIGVVDFIVKPVRTATLLAKVNKHMAARKDDS